MIHPPELVAHEAALAAQPKGTPRPWWEGRPFVVAMILLAFGPLLWPHIPPLVDLGGHMGRYKVALDYLPAPAFDYLWLLDMRPIPRSWVADWEPVWAGEGSILLRRKGDERPPPTTRRTASERDR